MGGMKGGNKMVGMVNDGDDGWSVDGLNVSTEGLVGLESWSSRLHEAFGGSSPALEGWLGCVGNVAFRQTAIGQSG